MTTPPNPSSWNKASTRLMAAHARKLYAAIGHAHPKRNTSKACWAEWEQACAAWHAHRNPLDGLFNRMVGVAVREASGPWRDAAITFLEVSPRYFRSGYLRDHVCNLLKQSQGLQAPELTRIHAALLDGIARRPSVGRFKHDCRLAARWATPTFEVQLKQLAQRKDSWIGGRARRMAFALAAHQLGLRKRRCGADAWAA